MNDQQVIKEMLNHRPATWAKGKTAWDPGWSYDGHIHLVNDTDYWGQYGIPPEPKHVLARRWADNERVESLVKRYLLVAGYTMTNKVIFMPPTTMYIARTIEMPPKWAYRTANMYYSALLHECTHSTITITDRKTVVSELTFGLRDTSQEETVACFGEAILMNRLGLRPDYRNLALYVNDWMNQRRWLNDDAKFLREAFKDATLAADIITNP